MKIRERDIENYLVRQIDKIGGKAYKFSSPGNKAVPDRICILPFGKTIFVECKAPGKVPTPLQHKIHKYMRELGHTVLVIDSKELVSLFIESIKAAIKRKRKEIRNDVK